MEQRHCQSQSNGSVRVGGEGDEGVRGGWGRSLYVLNAQKDANVGHCRLLAEGWAKSFGQQGVGCVDLKKREREKTGVP